MSDVQAPAPLPPRSHEGTTWQRRTVLVLLAALAIVLVVVIVYTALPRWWAQRVGDQVDGDLTTGLTSGFVYGFLCTLLPLFLLAFVYRFLRRRPLAWTIGGVGALVLAAPNLITLWIVVGTGNSAHAADRTLDVEAPWFRGGMLIGVLAALATAGLLASSFVSRRRARRAAAQAREELQAARRRPPVPPPRDPAP